MTKTASKKSAPAELFVASPEKDVDRYAYSSVKAAFEDGNNIVYVYKLVGKKQLVVKVEDAK